MAAERPRLGVRHPTVVPTNFGPDSTGDPAVAGESGDAGESGVVDAGDSSSPRSADERS